MADRRDVPRVALPLHLRPGLPGRAHRARARARARLLLVRRARVRQEGHGARSSGSPKQLGDDEWQFRKVGARSAACGRRSARTTTARGSSTARASS